MPKANWRILEPAEVASVARAFAEAIDRSNGSERAWLEEARIVFLTVVSTGIRYCEMQELRWRDVDLVDGVL
jgi:integrase